MKILARAIAGHTEDKRWFVILGDRNSGKGVIEKALRVALVNPLVMIDKPSGSTLPEAQRPERLTSSEVEAPIKLWTDGKGLVD